MIPDKVDTTYKSARYEAPKRKVEPTEKGAQGEPDVTKQPVADPKDLYPQPSRDEREPGKGERIDVRG